VLQARRDRVPVVQRGLQGARDIRDRLASDEVAADHDQGAVAAADLQGSKLHTVLFNIKLPTLQIKTDYHSNNIFRSIYRIA
jgi:hypothetical protein